MKDSNKKLIDGIEYFNKKELYEILGIGKTTLNSILTEIKLNPIKFGKIYRFSKNDITIIKEFISKHSPLKSYFYRKTCLNTYGVNNISKLDWIKEKKRESTLKTLGVGNPLQSDKLKKQGMLLKYGVDNPAKSPILLQKRIETTLNRTDEERKLSYEKRQDSLREKYGDNYKQILTEKGIETNKKNHNGEFYFGTKEQLKQASDTYYAKTGYRHPSQNPNTRKNHRTNYYLDNYEFDSSWELAYYIYLRDNSIPFEFHTVSISYEYNNKVHYYIPDFKVYNRIVEIKGNHLLKNNVFEEKSRAKAKYDCMVENNVLILTLEDIKPYITYVKNKYGNNYLKECRNKKD